MVSLCIASLVSAQDVFVPAMVITPSALDQHLTYMFKKFGLLGENPQLSFDRGLDYYLGRNGKEQSYSEAVKWFRKAAEQGDAAAQRALGVCYDNGYGVEQSDSEAIKWYQKAADQGDASALEALALKKLGY